MYKPIATRPLPETALGPDPFTCCALGVLLVAFTGVMTGCARTSTTPLDADTIEIAVRVGAICDGADADRLARRQAAVETLRRGFDDFIVVDSAGGDHVADYAPVTARTNLYGHTGTLFREDAPLLAHRRVLTIRMLRAGEDDSGESLSARAVLSGDRETIATGGAPATCLGIGG